MKKRKFALLHSVIALLLCISMLMGTTFAWFTDGVTSGNNRIVAGNLDVELEHLVKTDAGYQWQPVTEETNVFEENTLWEPGHTEVVYLKVSNLGSLALQYQLGVNIAAESGSVNMAGEEFVLSDYIRVGVVTGLDETEVFADREAARAAQFEQNELIKEGYVTTSKLYPVGNVNNPADAKSEEYVCLVVYMPEDVGNEANYRTGELPPRIDLGINLLASQHTFENDSFGNDYDYAAGFPEVNLPAGGTTDVTVSNGATAEDVTISGNNVSAEVPAGVQVENGTTALELSVTELSTTGSNVTLATNEVLKPVDVHVSGVSASNTTPIKVRLNQFAPIGLNEGNLKLYHVENGETVAMTFVAAETDLTAHNQFTYDPATGNIVLYLASFSEVALVADTENAWEGNFDYSWYNASKNDLTIANADQLAAFGAIVGGMNGQAQDSFTGKTVKLIANVNLGDKESENNSDLIFYPVGYNSSDGKYEKTGVAVTTGFYSFCGTFDGNGHTIENFYHNTWEMKGDHDWYTPAEQYYRDGMGLFGRVYGGTIKNLTVKNFSSDGEIATTGVIAAYADGATFENISIFNCNPRVYNIGNGGIVGCVGWYAKEANLKTTFTNITVDNSNKISALWGSYDVACGGIVGQYYPTSGQTSAGTPKNGGIDLVNCHVSAQMDVYNDVCGNYQYYAYRYAGMIIGSIRENTTNKDGKTIPNMTGISATGCTVNYGDWNDYYYCEFEKNGHPSYSGPDDYKFSRVPHSELIFTDSNGNGLVDADERASVTGCKHEHTDVEDNRAVYLPFYQLFTGYSWGVSSIGLKEYSGIVTDLGITEGDQQESVEKFKALDDLNISNGMPIKASQLVSYIENCGVEVKNDAFHMGITNVDENGKPIENGTVTAVFTPADNWADSTIILTGTGRIQITVQDYYFCTPTTIEVTVTDRQPEVKFEVAFDHDTTDGKQNHINEYLYRVGNKNTVSLSSLFAELNGVTVDVANVEATISTQSGNATGTFAANASDWTKGTIQFSGTGVVKVTITDNDYCTPTVLTLEVVNATNVPKDGKISNYGVTSVLLGDTSVSTLYLNGGATLYGNGFTIDCTNAPITGTGNVSENYVIGLSGAHLDNVKIVGKVYTKYGAMASSDYNRALIISTGNSTITNCYLSNTASPIRINSGSLVVKDTTVKGGNFANIDVRSGHLTLDNVTTINQALGNDKADDGSTVIGLGIVVYYEMVNTSATSITVKNGLTQNNNISSEDKFSNDYAKQFVNGMFDSSNAALQYTDGDTKWVNTGIILMTDGITVTGAGSKHAVSFMSLTGAVYTQIPSAESVREEPIENSAYMQGVVEPSVTLDHDNAEKGNYILKEADKNDYCYFDGQVVQISMDEGDVFNYDPFILDAKKLTYTLEYTVKCDGKEIATNSKIAFNEAGKYTITYTYTDPYNYRLDENGVLKSFEVTYIKTDVVIVAVVEAKAEHAKFTFATNSTATEEILYNNNTYISAKGVTADGTTWGKITVGDKTINYPIVAANVNRNTSKKECQVFYYVFKNVVSITDANGTVYSHDNGTGTDGKMPGNLKVIKGNELKVENNVFTSYNDTNLSRTAGKIFCYSSSSQEDAPEAFKGALAYKSPSGLSYSSSRNYDAAVIVQYQFTDSNNATYYYYVGYKINNPKNGTSGDGTDSGSCVTPDTLVTLADGTQKRIDQVTYADKLLVWDFYKGDYAVVPSAIIFDHGADNNDVIRLSFSDGTVVKVVNLHQFFDATLNCFVTIDADTVEQFVGHNFAKQGGVVRLVDYEVTKEYVEAWGIISAAHYNIFVEGMLSTDFMVEDYGLFNYFEVGADMKYDTAKMAADIAEYGLYTYEDFADHLTYEQFAAFNVPYFKVAVGKGNYTYEGILNLIEEYLHG